MTEEQATELLSQLINAERHAVKNTNSNRGCKNAYARVDSLVVKVFRELTGGLSPTGEQLRRIVE